MARIEVFAPAKINLTLHITGRRDDGYHLLDSLVTFAPVGDTLWITGGGALSLIVDGPECAGVPGDMDNLALRAAALVAGKSAALTLRKRVPAASGIGGGSADAAAAYRGMQALNAAAAGITGHGRAAAPDTGPDTVLIALGADVPMCLLSAPLRARGIGERLDPVSLPRLPAVLVNPRLPVSTPAIFHALDGQLNPPMPDPLPDFSDAAALIDWLATMRNDLQTPAIATQPAICDVLAALRAEPGCALARMSGSGATCFGLFESEARACEAARALQTAHPGWWVEDGVLGDQSAAAAPRIS